MTCFVPWCNQPATPDGYGACRDHRDDELLAVFDSAPRTATHQAA